MKKSRILILAPYFSPSKHGGGSVTALNSLVERMKSELELVVATGAYDLHASLPYSAAECSVARNRTGIEIQYLPRGVSAIAQVHAGLSQNWDFIYLNSVLSPTFAAIPLLLRAFRRPGLPVLLAPRGELMAGAIGSRRTQKLRYLRLLKWLGCLRGVQFHATSAPEASELRQLDLDPIHLAGDLPPLVSALPVPHTVNESSPLKLVFLSRIDVKKNLLFTLKALAQVQLPVDFDIFGPVGDSAYWANCCDEIERLPASVKVRYMGPVAPEQAIATLAHYELFILPTRAENNGYVIHEALLAGCALLISDQTPWRNLTAAGIGSDLPLNIDEFTKALNSYAEQPPFERTEQRRRAQAYGIARLDANADLLATRKMFSQVLSRQNMGRSA